MELCKFKNIVITFKATLRKIGLPLILTSGRTAPARHEFASKNLPNQDKSNQCDQMAFIIFNICPFTTMKTCSNVNLPKYVTIFAKY